MSNLGGQINFGRIERMELELPLNEKYKDEATRSEKEKSWHEDPKYFFQSKTLNIQSFNIKRFSNINYIDNMDSIVNYIKETVSDDVDGIKFKSGGHDFAVTFLT